MSVQPKRVIGYLIPWDYGRSFQTLKDNSDIFTDISPFWYTLNDAGKVVPVNANHISDVKAELVSFLQCKGIKLVPTITNHKDGVWDASLVSQIITDPDARERHIAEIVGLVVSNDYDGIDIDYESLHGNDRQAFSDFIKALAQALHSENKTLSVVAYAATEYPQYELNWSGNVYDYTVLGQEADQVRLMAYNYHWTTSDPGPIAPKWWAEQVTAFAVRQMPKEKTILGLGLYGIDWVGNKGRERSYQEIMEIVNTHSVIPHWHNESASSWFNYTDASGYHTVWFENAQSVADKIKVAEKYEVGGVHFWHLGGEHPLVWQEVRSSFVSAAPNPSSCDH